MSLILKCPNCGGSASLPLEMSCRDHRPVLVPDHDEPSSEIAALTDELQELYSALSEAGYPWVAYCPTVYRAVQTIERQAQ